MERVSPYIYIENFKNLLQKVLDRFQYNFAEMFNQDCSSHHDSPRKNNNKKNMASRGQGLFSLYICMEKFQIAGDHWTNSVYQKY